MKIRFCECAIVLALSTTAVSAHEVRPFSFWDLEYAYDADDAERIGKQDIARLVPSGTRVDAATRALRDAGARCHTSPGAIVCDYTAFEAVEEMEHDLVWTVTMPVNGDRIMGATATRESLGG